MQSSYKDFKYKKRGSTYGRLQKLKKKKSPFGIWKMWVKNTDFEYFSCKNKSKIQDNK